jgi:hypothetical protein
MAARSPAPHARRSRRSPRSRGAGILVVALAVAIALATASGWTPSVGWENDAPVSTRALLKLERIPAPELGRGFERWRMIGARRDTVTGIWRAGAADGRGATAGASPAGAADAAGAAPAAQAEWSVVVLGGIGTDDRAALLVPDSLPVNVLAVSWPWKGARQMGTWQFIANTPAIRGALLRTPDALVRGITAVRQARPGTRVALVGASLGVPPTVAAMRQANVDALVLIDGAADLGRLLYAEAGRSLGERTFTARFAQACSPVVAWVLAPLEPSRRHPSERAIPTLIIDAEDEERLPRACVTALHQRFPHATLATHPGAHMRPENPEQMEAILRAVWDWLAAAGRQAPSLADRTPLP